MEKERKCRGSSDYDVMVIAVRRGGGYGWVG